ncbi:MULTISPECIES: iron chaperone [unclassified Agrococcus]|uniref:iron chaperone n=1 Tax=unclassified Agrococcus TaxID=2615065 RepID=UPI0036098979
MSTKTGFSDDERAAMQQRAEELRTTKGLKGAARLAKELEACVAAIDGLDGADRAVASTLHRIVAEVAPDLAPKTWYGFPSYARDGEVVVFYQPASKFGTRYGTVGFQEGAALDDGPMWATTFAVVEVTDAVERQLRELVAKAVATA